ncbi:phosphotransferase family protein [Shimia thalassica]|uniref:phosphotransferase family protein n=1 Tax=Shimia thalassica TaxID=1715693 RepID=UPI0026E15EFA|nr:phosphotransferase family protein [Shimia thalassica]MDO6521422.1 phosphotransferase family protein [Shimia thalassica]
MVNLQKIDHSESPVGLDLPKLRSHLAQNGMTLDASFVPQRFAAGFGNMNFLVEVDGAPMVLRRPPLGPIPPGANDMAREYRILSHLHDAYPLVPCAHLFCDDTDVIGAPFFLMEYRPGLVIGAAIPLEVKNAWSSDIPIGQLLGANMINVLAGLHAVDPAACGLETLGKPDGFLERTLRGWTKRAELSWAGDPAGELQAVLDWLASNRPAETKKPTLIHNDFKLDNIILDPETLEARTLIDWDMGTIGDPRFDLAILLSYWSEASDPAAMHDLKQMPTACHGFPTREEAAQYYARASDCDLNDFTFYRVLATLRIAVVFQQLYRRYQSGGTNDPKFGKFNDLALGLLDFAFQISRGKYF